MEGLVHYECLIDVCLFLTRILFYVSGIDVYVPCTCGVHRSQMGMLAPLELEFQKFMSHCAGAGSSEVFMPSEPLLSSLVEHLIQNK